MKIISISGLDGSGKSTQVEMLCKHFKKQGKKVYYFHATHFSIGQLSRKASVSKAKRQHASVTKASWIKIQLRKLALLIDLIRFKFFVQKLEKQSYDILISDRYFYDSIINIAFLEKKHVATFEPKVIKPWRAFYLKVDPGVIMSRERTADQGIEYLKEKKYLLDSHAPLWKLAEIDGNRSKDVIFSDILSRIEK